MTFARQILAGVLAGIIAVAAVELFAEGFLAGMVLLSIFGLLLFLGVAGGQHLPPFWRALISIFVLYWAYNMCLLGRTMTPGLTLTAVRNALVYFFLMGALPGLVLLRLWPLRRGISLFLALFPAAFLLAAIVAGTEEYLFVQKYRETGIGPTPRRTVSNHWLAYDAKSQRLDGSD